MEEMICPACKERSLQDELLGFLQCPHCEYCVHTSLTGNTCDCCFKKIEPLKPCHYCGKKDKAFSEIKIEDEIIYVCSDCGLERFVMECSL